MMIKQLYVTDTNALYWYLIGDKKLTKNARAVFEAAERGEIVPTCASNTNR